jgi:four helix bundle protein
MIKQFEDVKAWQEARILVNMIYEVSNSGLFSKDWRLRDQIRDAAGSVMHNIAEGFDAGSDAEFVRFLKYARRSGSEVQSQLYIALDQEYLHQHRFQQLYDQATRTKKLINAFISYLERSRSQSLAEPELLYQITEPPSADQPDLSDQAAN